MERNATIIPVDPATLRALAILEDAGLEAWMVGGCVRDALLGRPVNDVDIACSGLWTETQAAFRAAGCPTYETGTTHGTLTVEVDDRLFEVTTYRVDGTYSDSRHPDSVTFARSIDDDLARRDFTVNAMAYHPARGLHDPYAGQDDLRASLLRAVGDPAARFTEDALRILRGVRFASQLGFEIEPATEQAMRANVARLDLIARERIAHEIEGTLCGDHAYDALMRYAEIVLATMPPLAPMHNFDQHSIYHCYDVWEHSVWAVQRIEPTPRCRWAAFLHDCGKPDTFSMEGTVGHFYGHAHLSAVIAKAVLRSLHLPRRLIDDIVLLVRYHDAVIQPTPVGVKKMLARLDGRVDLFRDLCKLKRADALAHAAEYQKGDSYAAMLEECLEQVLAQKDAFTLKQLAVDGKDIIGLGVPAGPQVGRILRTLLDAVIDETLPNERTALLAFVAEAERSGA